MLWGVGFVFACGVSFVLGMFVLGPRTGPGAPGTATISPADGDIVGTPAPEVSAPADAGDSRVDRLAERDRDREERASRRRPSDEARRTPETPAVAAAPTTAAAGASDEQASEQPAPNRTTEPAGARVTVRPAAEHPLLSDSGAATGARDRRQEAPPATDAEPAPTAPKAEPAPAAPVGQGALYRVEVGSPQTTEDSQRLAAELRKMGYPSRVAVEGSIYHVQAGAFRVRRNAEKLAAELGNKGYAATIAGGPSD